MTAILDFLNSFITILYNILTWLLEGIIIVLQATLSLIFEGFLTVVYAFIAALNVGQLAVDVSTAWGLLPQPVAYLVSISGLPTGLSLIGISYLIRFLLNLIPSWATRV